MLTKIRELEAENKKLKMGGGSPYGAPANEDRNFLSGGFNSSSQNFYKSGGTNRAQAAGGFGAGGLAMERPMTAAGGNQKVRELENQLRDEQRNKKRLIDEVEALKKELHKSSFAQFTQNSGEVSVTAGRLPAVPGVREITLEDLELGEQIG